MMAKCGKITEMEGRILGGNDPWCEVELSLGDIDLLCKVLENSVTGTEAAKLETAMRLLLQQANKEYVDLNI